MLALRAKILLIFSFLGRTISQCVSSALIRLDIDMIRLVDTDLDLIVTII